MKLDNGVVINPNNINCVSNIETMMGIKGFCIHFGPEDYVFTPGDEKKRLDFLSALADRINEENRL